MTVGGPVFLPKLKELFGVDLRSLALFRVALASLILYDLLDRLWDLRDFYTDWGLLPRAELIARSPGLVSLHLMTGRAEGLLVLFGVQWLIALALLVGWKTRWMTFLSWALMASLHSRNHLVCGGGDDYLRLLLFWSMFVPLGARFSIDALKAGGEVRRTPFVSLGALAILFQTALVYWMAGIYKLREPVWLEGNAIYYALSVFNYSKDAADVLLRHPEAMRAVTYAVFAIELGGPFLFFFPYRTGPVRTAAVLIFVALHIGFFFCLYLKNFPWVSMTALLPFLPAWFWDRYGRPVQPPPWLAAAARHLGSGGSVALKRFWWSETLAAAFFVLVVWWNVAEYRDKPMPAALRNACQTLAIAQKWKMFCPPVKKSGWFVVVGKLQNGMQVDLNRQGAPVNWEKPSRASLHRNERWRRYMKNFLFGKNKGYWPAYGRYLCRRWAASDPVSPLSSIEIIAMERTTMLDGSGSFKRRVVFRHDCLPPKARVPKKSLSPPVEPMIG